METTLPAAPPLAATRDYSLPMRIWHWANATLVTGQLLTILFLKVIVNPRSAVPEFRAALGRDGIALSEQQGRGLAHIVSDRIWTWHVWIGLTLAGFWLFWTLMQALDPAGRRFGARLLAAARRVKLAAPAEKGETRTALFAKFTYAAFYLLITLMVVTGLALTWADDVPAIGNVEHSIKEVHEVGMYLIMAFIAVHVVGVVWAEATKDHGLVSRMVGGESNANNR